MRPSRLADLLAWEELDHDRLDIEHRRSVDCIEFSHEQLGTFDSDDATNRATDSIRAVLAALSKDADSWPGSVIPRMPSASGDLGWFDFMEEEEDLNMGELGQPLQRLARKPLGKGDASALSAPEIIFRVGTRCLNKPDCFNLCIHREYSFRDAKREHSVDQPAQPAWVG